MDGMAQGLIRQYAERKIREGQLSNEFEGLKAEANRVIGECQGKIQENAVVVKWLEDMLQAAGIDISPEAIKAALQEMAAEPPQVPQGGQNSNGQGRNANGQEPATPASPEGHQSVAPAA